MQNHEVKFVDSKHYRGDCRRHHKRYPVVLPATLVYNENEGVVKVLDIAWEDARWWRIVTAVLMRKSA